ncbi:MAG TPA: hypothetical protein QF517_11275, partial [Pseudomonadales bacterium]|nr:hypothetical protein [Pseudomonadales bacterium]
PLLAVWIHPLAFMMKLQQSRESVIPLPNYLIVMEPADRALIVPPLAVQLFKTPAVYVLVVERDYRILKEWIVMAFAGDRQVNVLGVQIPMPVITNR